MPLLSRSGKGRTQILLDGAEPLDVMETLGHVLQQIENAKWAVLRLDEHTAVHVRSSAVVGLVELGHHEAESRLS